jgi:hypothetical protein
VVASCEHSNGPSGSLKRRGMYCLAEELYRSEDGLCLMRLHNFVNLWARLHLAGALVSMSRKWNWMR